MIISLQKFWAQCNNCSVAYKEGEEFGSKELLIKFLKRDKWKVKSIKFVYCQSCKKFRGRTTE